MARRVVLHLTLLGVGLGVFRVAVVPAEVCPEVTAAQVERTIDEAAAWLVRGLGEDGRYVYGYDRNVDLVSPDYNGTRHAGVTMALYQYAAAAGRPDVVGAADRGLAFMLDHLLTEGEWLAWRSPGEEVQLGANALLTAALVMRRRATGDEGYDALMRGVGRFLVAQQQPDGSMHGYWDPSTRRSVPVQGKFATGEAAWALALLDGELPGEGWAAPALPTIDYLALHRDRDMGFLTRMPDHWAAYAMAELGPAALDGVRPAYARAGVGTAGEGMAAIWRLAQDDSRLADLVPNVEDRLACFAGMMVERQATAAEAAGYPRPGLVQGAWFYRGYVQMDDVQHVMAGLLASLPVLESREGAG
ncbi:MAG: hypothetical protein H6Q11_1533 [Acidobacteria bacterium]|nr:hypothetical protein [Acidobacteriota bacterium]